MHTSEALTAPPPEGPDYPEALAAFRARHGLGPGEVVAVFHAVRNMPYFSGPDRTPQAALRSGRGACTAKHLVLRDLLRDLGETAEVELVEGNFGAGLPTAKGMPESLAAMIRDGGVRDIHCRVLWQGPEGPLRLDATWPDNLAKHGFPVDGGWCGQGDTRPAIKDAVIRGTALDVLASKELYLGELTPEERERRRVFLRLLSEWLERQS